MFARRRATVFVRAIAGTTALLVLGLAACSGGDDSAAATGEPTDPPASPEPSPSPTTDEPPPHYTFAELAAAMPDPDELPAGYLQHDSSCLAADDEGCEPGDDGQPRAAVLVAVGGDSDAETDLLRVSATAHADPAAAEAAITGQREHRATEYGGPFDIPADEDGDGYVPGRRGQGHLGDLEIGEWSGYQLVMVYATVDPDGQVDDSASQHGYLVLGNGNAEIEVEVRMPGGHSMADTVQARLDDWMRMVLDQLA